MSTPEKILEGLFGIEESTPEIRKILGFEGGIAFKNNNNNVDMRAILARKSLVSDQSNLITVPGAVLQKCVSIETLSAPTHSM